MIWYVLGTNNTPAEAGNFWAGGTVEQFTPSANTTLYLHEGGAA